MVINGVSIAKWSATYRPISNAGAKSNLIVYCIKTSVYGGGSKFGPGRPVFSNVGQID